MKRSRDVAKASSSTSINAFRDRLDSVMDLDYCSQYFENIVDLGLNHYDEIINPAQQIDFAQISDNVDNGHYETLTAFWADCERVFENTLTYYSDPRIKETLNLKKKTTNLLAQMKRMAADDLEQEAEKKSSGAGGGEGEDDDDDDDEEDEEEEKGGGDK